MKKILLTALVLAALLSACGREAEPAETAAATETASETAESNAFMLREEDVEAAFAASFMSMPETEPQANIAASTTALPYMQETNTAARTSAAMRTTTTAVPATTTRASISSIAANATAKAVVTTKAAAATNAAAATAAVTTAKATTTTTKATTTTAFASTSSTTTSRITITTTTTTSTIAQAAVSFSIDGSAAVPYGYDVFLPAQTMTLNDGESVLDLLNRCGVSVQSSGSGRMAYVSAIGGLREKACGGSSGWVYEVNGARSPVSCGAYQPKSGDEIVWRYSLTP